MFDSNGQFDSFTLQVDSYDSELLFVGLIPFWFQWIKFHLIHLIHHYDSLNIFRYFFIIKIKQNKKHATSSFLLFKCVHELIWFT